MLALAIEFRYGQSIHRRIVVAWRSYRHKSNTVSSRRPRRRPGMLRFVSGYRIQGQAGSELGEQQTHELLRVKVAPASGRRPYRPSYERKEDAMLGSRMV